MIVGLDVNTRSYKGAHFATFSPDLIKPCVLAGSSERGCCPICAAPWWRVVERGEKVLGNAWSATGAGGSALERNDRAGCESSTLKHFRPAENVGWRPGCDHYGTPPLPKYPRPPQEKKYDSRAEYEAALAEHDAACVPIRAERLRLLKEWEALPTVPCIVLDPFG